MLDKKQYNKYLKECSLIITHGGVGTILDGLKIKKTIIAFPRLTKYKEAVNDHQIQIVEAFNKKGYILTGEIKELKSLLEKAKIFKAPLYKSNKENFNDFIIDLIQQNKLKIFDIIKP